jgi:hypothetical protein
MNRRVFFAKAFAGAVGLAGLGKGASAFSAPSGPASRPVWDSPAPKQGLSAFQRDLISKPIDPEEVREAFEGNHHCQWLLGEYLEALPHTEPDWTRALSRLREAARAGDTRAAEFLGNHPSEWAGGADWRPRGLMRSGVDLHGVWADRD